MVGETFLNVAEIAMIMLGWKGSGRRTARRLGSAALAWTLLGALLALPSGCTSQEERVVVNASSIRGCTVPTAENFKAAAVYDDGSCRCADRSHPDPDEPGAECYPVPVVVPARPDAPLCPPERPLPCMRCDDATKTCIFQCEEASGATCSKLRLEADAFERSVHTTKELYLATVVVVAILITASVLIDGSSWRWLQESMAFVTIGVGIACVVLLWTRLDSSQSGDNYFEDHIEFDGSVFFFMLLPPIILDSGYNMKKSRFFKNIDSILLFAVVGTSFSTCVIGTILYQSEQYFEGLGIFKNIWEAMQFGALISATDPVASLSVLSSAKGRLRDKTLTSLIFGEAVLNDAIAIVLYTMFARLAEDDSIRGGAELASGLSLAGKVTFGSLGIGLAVGALFSVLTRHMPKHFAGEPHIEVSQMFLAAYGSYLAADYAELSGIISLFACATMLSHYTKYNLEPESQKIVKATIHTVAFLSEAIVFAYLGVDLVLGVDWYTINWLFVGLTLATCLVARALHVFPLSAILNWRKSCKADRPSEQVQRVPFNSQVVLWFAGLRGPIAYALAKMWREQSDDPAFHQIVSTTMLVVVATTFLCGGSFAAVLECLDMEEVPYQQPEDGDVTVRASHSPRWSPPAHSISTAGSSPRNRPNYDCSPHAVLNRMDSDVNDWSLESGLEFEQEQTMVRYRNSDCVQRWKHLDDTYLKPLLGGKPRRNTSRADASEDSSILSESGRDLNPLQSSSRRDATHATPKAAYIGSDLAASSGAHVDFGEGVPRDSTEAGAQDFALSPATPSEQRQ
eukprot:COSAG02_NODE_3408_length_6792_cov_2.887345_1_plen_797_part_00